MSRRRKGNFFDFDIYALTRGKSKDEAVNRKVQYSHGLGTRRGRVMG